MAYVSGANERRVDGGRVTEMVLAEDWIGDRPPGQRGPDVNPLIPTKAGPPALPFGKARDHIHDRNRETSLYDPAQPGVKTYVRVTRRREDLATEQKYLTAKEEKRQSLEMKEAREAADANELLALRSMLVKGQMSANRESLKARAAGYKWKPPEPVKESTRADELHKKVFA